MMNVNLSEYLNSLEGDVLVDNITVLPGLAQERNYTTGRGELERRDFTIVDWGHDGISCVDVYITKDGCIDVYADDEDEIFEAIYNKTHASLRIDIDEIPNSLREAFLATATVRMDYED